VGRRVWPAACLGVSLLAGERFAFAEPPAATPYALPLGLSYVVLPALTIGAAVAFSDANDTEGTALVVGVGILGLAAPAVVHALHGEPSRAVVSPLATLGFTSLGALAGAGVGALVADAECPDTPTEDHADCGLAPKIAGIFTGAAVGYVTWAVYDTAARSSPTKKGAVSVTVAPRIHRTTMGLDVIGVF
jgi:hypothetical protein